MVDTDIPEGMPDQWRSGVSVRKRDESQVRVRRSARRRWVGRAAGVAVVAAVAVGVAPGVADAQPYRPSNSDISAAQQAANDAAAQVGQITAQLATAQAAVDSANAHANLALDQYWKKQQAYDDAVKSAATAKAAADKAQVDLSAARVAVAKFARDSYMSGSTSSRMTSLVTSGSPAQMLERMALLSAAGDNRSQVLTTVAVVEKQAQAANTAAQTAATQAGELKQQAQAALDAAQAEKSSAIQQQQAFQAQQDAAHTSLQQAQATLASLQGQVTVANNYDAQQAAAAAASNAAPPPAAAPSGPPAGAGSSSAAETAIAAASRYIGTPYAWGGGSLTGPSWGFWPDLGVMGFDCSGLTRFAYAQAGIVLPRVASDQYLAAPHVSGSNLQRGDLVFYATNTSQAWTIHHVAIYLGNGQMLEAPESGKSIRVTAMRWGEFIGGARPSA
jgi:cell wall-associated NlpC family hydrolase